MKREDIERIVAELNELKCKTQKEVEEARIRFLGKKGEVTRLFEEFRTIDKELKKEFGKTLIDLKQAATAKIEQLKDAVCGEAAEEGGIIIPLPVHLPQILEHGAGIAAPTGGEGLHIPEDRLQRGKEKT